MKELLILTKVFFNTSIDFSRKKARHTGSYIYLICFGLLAALLFGGLSYAYYAGLLGVDLPKHSLIITCLVILSAISFVLNFFSMYTVLFKSKDFDFLASSPLKKTNIITAKLLAMFLFSFVIDVIGMIPVLVFYMIKGGTVIGLICGIVGAIFAGVIPLLLSTFVGALVGVITVKFKHGDAISIVAYLLLFLGFAIGSVFMVSSSGVLISGDKILPYFKFLSNSIINNNPIGILWFVLINIGSFILVVAFTSLIYFPINQAKKNNVDGHYKSGKEKTSLTTSRLLFNKEIKMITRNPLFLLSTYAMPVIMFVIALVLVGVLGKGFFDTTKETLNKVLTYLNLWELLIFVLIGSICIPTYASFSMEGRDNLEQLFVYPLDKNKIISAKIKASIIPTSIILAIFTSLLVLIFAIVQGFDKISPWTWLSAIILPILACFSGTYIGTLCGLKWIKLDFVDANDILKKSKAMGLTVLFSCLLNLVIFAGYAAMHMLFFKQMPYLGFVVGAGAELIAIIILAIITKKKAPKMLEQALIK